MGASMDQRGTSLSLYSVICPRCETVSPMDQPACPYCGADRHGAVLTKGAATAVRAVEAARAVLHHAYERGELTPIEPIRPMQRDALLPVTARPLGLPASGRRIHPVLIAGVIAGVALGVVSWIRADLERASPRARLQTVSAAGEIHKAQPAALVAPNTPEPAAQTRVFATLPPMTASPSLSCCANPPENVAAPEKAAKPAPEARKRSSNVHARVKQKGKTVVAQSSSNRQKVRETACTSKNARHCASKEKTLSKRQANRTANDANAFQQVNAPPAPIKPAMTSDGSWKPSKKTN
jgi:hypothetical protein